MLLRHLLAAQLLDQLARVDLHGAFLLAHAVCGWASGQRVVGAGDRCISWPPQQCQLRSPASCSPAALACPAEQALPLPLTSRAGVLAVILKDGGHLVQPRLQGARGAQIGFHAVIALPWAEAPGRTMALPRQARLLPTNGRLKPPRHPHLLLGCAVLHLPQPEQLLVHRDALAGGERDVPAVGGVEGRE